MEVDSSSRWMKPPVENDTESLDLNSDNDRDESKENSDNEKNNKISKRSTHTQIENVKKMKKEKKNGMKRNTKSNGGTPKSVEKLKREATVKNGQAKRKENKKDNKTILAKKKDKGSLGSDKKKKVTKRLRRIVAKRLNLA